MESLRSNGTLRIVPSTTAPAVQAVAAEPVWSPLKKILFRWTCSYFFFYTIPFPLDAFPYIAQIPALREAVERPRALGRRRDQGDQIPVPSPTLDRLVQPFGDASPMGLVWTFMGASTAYPIFAAPGCWVGW